MAFHFVPTRHDAQALKDFLKEFGARSRMIRLSDSWLVMEFK